MFCTLFSCQFLSYKLTPLERDFFSNTEKGTNYVFVSNKNDTAVFCITNVETIVSKANNPIEVGGGIFHAPTEYIDYANIKINDTIIADKEEWIKISKSSNTGNIGLCFFPIYFKTKGDKIFKNYGDIESRFCSHFTMNNHIFKDVEYAYSDSSMYYFLVYKVEGSVFRHLKKHDYLDLPLPVAT